MTESFLLPPLLFFFTVLPLPVSAGSENITTFAEEHFGFVPEPDGRGTFGILWSCLAALFLCTWTVQHPNLGAPHERGLEASWRRIGYVLLTIFSPELVCSVAMDQWRHARRLVQTMKGENGCSSWNMMHGFYLCMGGYKIKSADGTLYSFSGDEIAHLVKRKVIEVPKIDIEDVRDRSKTDNLSKLLACAQGAWFLFQVIGRAVSKLPFATLEIATIPFIGCTFLMIYFWWMKPVNVGTYATYFVKEISEEMLEELRALFPLQQAAKLRPFDGPQRSEPFNEIWARFQDQQTSLMARILLSWDGCFSRSTQEREKEVLPTHYSQASRLHMWDEYAAGKDRITLAFCTFLGLAFVFFHLTAWKTSFPTPVESLLWKISALTSAIAILGLSALGLLWQHVPKRRSMDVFFYVATVIFMILNATARFYVIVEVFLGLRALPPGVFLTVNWVKYLPHVF